MKEIENNIWSEQIEKDVDRSLWNLSKVSDLELQYKRSQLSRILNLINNEIGELKLYKISISLDAFSSFRATDPNNPIRLGLYGINVSIIISISFCDNILQIYSLILLL